MKAELIAGILSGLTGLFVFLTIHHFWIKPIWFILFPGLVAAGLGGLAVGWSYAEIRSALPPRPLTELAMFGLIGVILAPSILLAQLRPPPFDITTGAIISGSSFGVVMARVTIELLVTASVVGGLAGWLLVHTPQAAASTAIAGLIFAIGPGHNIPLLGSTPAVGKGILLLIAIIAVSSIVLVESHVLIEGTS